MSQSIDDRLGDLLKLYISGSCNNEEYQELLALLKVQDDVSQIEELLLEEILNSRYHEAELQVNWQQMFQSVLQHQEAAIPAPVRKMALLKRLAVAAVAFIALASVAWWWLQKGNDRHTNAPAVTLTYDALPGRDGAVLTLNNGQTVLLDSAANGAIHLQPGLQVAKHDSLIAYQAAGAAINETNTLSTPRGRKFQLVLSDGTRVWLNAASSIRYPAVFTGKERVVDVTGEVYFEVAKNAARPFIVNILSSQQGTSKGRVEVLGTHFNINAYDDEENIKTTLLEGRVKASVANGQSVILKPAEQVSISQSSQLSQPIPVQTEEVMAWKNGYFQFGHADIKTVMRQVARWYDVDVQYEGMITTDKFGGSIPRDATLSQVLHALEQSLVHFTIQGKKVIVTP
jgi:ferric-dicitrate binding protein FerR (iron transport regulator)